MRGLNKIENILVNKDRLFKKIFIRIVFFSLALLTEVIFSNAKSIQISSIWNSLERRKQNTIFEESSFIFDT